MILHLIRPRRALGLAPSAIVAALLTAGLVPLTAASAATAQDVQRSHHVITVMTQNLDEGTDFTPLFTATTPAAFIAAATATFQEVVASDIPARAALVAGEIAAAAPDAVSLQEVSLWQVQSASGTASIDALAALEQALTADGAHYTVAAVLGEFSGGAPVPGIGQVSFLDRDVLLVRADEPPGQLTVTDVRTGHFATLLSLTTVAGPLTVPRGWISADLTLRGRTVRFVATHLESFSSAVQQAQGAELVAGPAADTELPVIIAGDLNTGPLAAGGFVTPTYQQILAAGFTDTWPVTNPGVAGMTNPFHAEDPFGPSVPDKRIDLVLVGGDLSPVSDTLTGTSTVGGLWPSDHAGVVATIRMPA